MDDKKDNTATNKEHEGKEFNNRQNVVNPSGHCAGVSISVFREMQGTLSGEFGNSPWEH